MKYSNSLDLRDYLADRLDLSTDDADDVVSNLRMAKGCPAYGEDWSDFLSPKGEIDPEVSPLTLYNSDTGEPLRLATWGEVSVSFSAGPTGHFPAEEGTCFVAA